MVSPRTSRFSSGPSWAAEEFARELASEPFRVHGHARIAMKLVNVAGAYGNESTLVRKLDV